MIVLRPPCRAMGVAMAPLRIIEQLRVYRFILNRIFGGTSSSRYMLQLSSCITLHWFRGAQTVVQFGQCVNAGPRL